jgi:hypothetical protein
MAEEQEIKKQMPDGKSPVKNEKEGGNDTKPGQKEAANDNRKTITDLQDERGEQSKEDQARRQGPYGVQEDTEK